MIRMIRDNLPVIGMSAGQALGISVLGVLAGLGPVLILMFILSFNIGVAGVLIAPWLRARRARCHG